MKYIVSAYLISGSLIFASNKDLYSPKSTMLKHFWDLLKIDTHYGKSTAYTFLVFSPVLIPVYSLTIPIIYEMDKLLNGKNHN